MSLVERRAEERSVRMCCYMKSDEESGRSRDHKGNPGGTAKLSICVCVCVLGDSECWRSRLRVTSTGEIYNMYCGGNRNVGYQFMTTELELLEQL